MHACTHQMDNIAFPREEFQVLLFIPNFQEGRQCYSGLRLMDKYDDFLSHIETGHE